MKKLTVWSLIIAMLVILCGFAGVAQAQWVPPGQLSWYWQLRGTVNNSLPAAAYDIDGFDNSAAEVASLHAAGKHVICYINVGHWESWRSDANQFPSSVLGNTDISWPGERWLDIRQLSVLEPIMTARFQMCGQKGFDALEADNIDGWENTTGFPITAADQLTYDEWVANEAHALGLAVFQKTDADQTSSLAPYFDGMLDEQCNEQSNCSLLTPYLVAGKPVMDAEYNLSTSQFCTVDNSDGIMAALYNSLLDGTTYQPCWSSSSPGPGPQPSPGPPSVAPPNSTPPRNTAAPTLRGRALRGRTLTTSNGKWSGYPTKFTYRWQDCNAAATRCINIKRATGFSYKLHRSDVGHRIRAIVTARNAFGSTSSPSTTSTIVTQGSSSRRRGCAGQLLHRRAVCRRR